MRRTALFLSGQFCAALDFATPRLVDLGCHPAGYSGGHVAHHVESRGNWRC